MTDCNCDYFAGNVGIGTPAATNRRLSILGAPASTTTIVELIQNGNSDSNYLWFKRSGGTTASPQPVGIGQTLGYFAGMGLDNGGSTSYGYGAHISFNPTGPWTTGSHPTNIQFSTASNGSPAPVVRMTIGDAGGAISAKVVHPGNIHSPGHGLVVSNGYSILSGPGYYEILGVWANNYGSQYSESVLTVRDNGRVGIGTGTAVPAAKLDVMGNLRVASVGSPGTPAASVHNAGGISSPGTALTVSNGYPIASGTGGYEIFGVHADTFDQDLFTVRDTGNVGIGISRPATPAAKLDVAGSLKVSGQTTLNGVSYTWPASGSGIGHVLTLNSGGQLSWSPAGASFWTEYDSGANAKLFPLNELGQVGVGFKYPNLPGAKLHVVNSNGTALFSLGATTSRQPRLNIDILNAGDGPDWPSVRFQADGAAMPHLAFAPGPGNVGVGTHEPATKLEVATQDGAQLLRLSAKSTRKPRLNVDIGSATDGTPTFLFQTDVDTPTTPKPHLVLAPAAGRVGIGTANPQVKLHVTGPSTPGVTVLEVSGGPPLGQGYAAKVNGDAQVTGALKVDGNIQGDKVFGAVYG